MLTKKNIFSFGFGILFVFLFGLVVDLFDNMTLKDVQPEYLLSGSQKLEYLRADYDNQYFDYDHEVFDLEKCRQERIEKTKMAASPEFGLDCFYPGFIHYDNIVSEIYNSGYEVIPWYRFVTKIKLRSAHRSWIRYRAKTCAIEKNYFSYWEPSLAQNPIICMYRITEARAKAYN